MNLKAYQTRTDKKGEDVCLFGAILRNKETARKYILNHGMLAKVSYVIFKNERYTIGKVYKW